eukprot:9315653-Pyramimonas_sp.AAC.1
MERLFLHHSSTTPPSLLHHSSSFSSAASSSSSSSSFCSGRTHGTLRLGERAPSKLMVLQRCDILGFRAPTP